MWLFVLLGTGLDRTCCRYRKMVKILVRNGEENVKDAVDSKIYTYIVCESCNLCDLKKSKGYY